ncbi:MAG: TetR/AcrR family transcriptional regulator [Hyphomicrobium sp.]|uniref:TetR/AcrR family transcriptional regulator n=1 Tax=Hyphomicrobium sp. TaxID=82 RepID=UPI0025C3252E|nr:TetR/AcrR family transcriptional regulator [Hyphomicrobium sp.]MBX9862750.1 TetR/AcrR family transcriptional regulator [Hyphomicrobium sp.]
MGRRSLHAADELRELIIGASTELIRDAGLEGLSAREIARRIDYSPGTIYNSFENLDDLVLTIEGRLIDSLLDALASLPQEREDRARVQKIARRYLEFVAENPKLWNLLLEHNLPASRAVPDWYRQKLEALMKTLERALLPLAKGGISDDDLSRSARVLWAGVHGIASLSTANKLSMVASDHAGVMMDDFVRTFLAGFEQGQ